MSCLLPHTILFVVEGATRVLPLLYLNQQVYLPGFFGNYSDLGFEIALGFDIDLGCYIDLGCCIDLGCDLGFDLGFLNNYHNPSAVGCSGNFAMATCCCYNDLCFCPDKYSTSSWLS